MIKGFISQVTMVAAVAQAKNVFKEKYQELFLKDSEAHDPQHNVKATSDLSIEDGAISLNIGEILNSFGVTQFVCQNPSGFTNFDASKLAGTWYQVYASRATDSFGCLSYTIATVSSANAGDLPALNVNAAWTAYNTYWNPFQKGQYAKTYELYGDENGRLFERDLTTNANTFSYIIDTDYSTYFVEYSCQQTLLDLWTIEYIDVFTKDGVMSSSSKTIDEIKTTIASLAPSFSTDTIVAATQADGCQLTTYFGIL